MVRHNCTLSSTTLWLLLALFFESAIGFQRSLPTKWLSTLKGSLLNHNLRQPLAAISSSSGSITFEVGAAETEELQAYYAANTGNGAVMNIADMVDIPELSEMVKRGELETKELEAIWTEVTGDKAIGADAAQFVRVWRGIEDLFEYDDIEEGEDKEDATKFQESKISPTLGNDENKVEDNDEVSVSKLPLSFLEGDAHSDWLAVSSNGAPAPKSAIFGSTFITELIADGDLSLSEAEDIWLQCVGEAVDEADEAAFGRFWYALDDLFEDDDSDNDNYTSLALGEGSRAETLEDAEDDPYTTTETSNSPWSSSPDEDWEVVSCGGPVASKSAVFGSAFIAELIGDGDLTLAEAEDIWEKFVGKDTEEADEAAFGQFWFAVDDLFEYEEPGEGDEGSSENSDEYYERIRDNILSVLDKLPLCGLGSDAETKKKIADLCKTLEQTPSQIRIRQSIVGTDERLAGKWELIYTSSESFEFNGGFTGVARTTPGGGEFENLIQELTVTPLSGGGGDATFVESLRIGTNGNNDGEGGVPRGANVPLTVDVDGAWELKRRINLMSVDDEETAVIDVTPQRLRYGPIEVFFCYLLMDLLSLA